uniref:DNA topoisomerase (ATP-hydrolyzing) n=1 Tax=Macrostomum lignano TaxID=282301 RepID=A0A1I8IYC5_9PLAT
MDGLKPSQRKVLYTCFKRRQRQPIRVPQLAGSVAELTAYRHGDGALFNTIVGMAQNFPGSNNINLLVPGGQFGSRLLGGKDAAAARYIYTCLSPLARLIFHPDDDALLNYRMEDGERVEPVSYSPVVPLAVVNGAEGIGTGWNTSIPNHSLADVMANLRHMLREGGTAEPLPMLPAFRGHTGRIVAMPDGRRFVSYGRLLAYANTGIFEITELPVRVWSEPYGCSLASLAESVNNYCSDWRVRFLVKLDPSQLARANRMGLYRYFRLSSRFSTGSMVLADSGDRMCRYQTVSDIMRDYFDHRLDMYRRRLDYQRAELYALVRLLSNQARFALDVAEGRLNLSGFTGRSDTNRRLSAAGFEPDPVRAAAIRNADDFNGGDEFDYLLRMPVWSLTLERRQRLLQDRDEAAGRLRQLAELTPARAWLEDLNALESRAATCTKEEAKQLGGGGDGEDGCETEQQSDHRPGHGQAVIRPPAGLMPTVVSPPCDLVSDAAGTPKRTRTHLHGRLFSPAFEDPTPAAVDAAGNDDNNNSGSRKQQLAAERTTKQRRRGRNPARLLSRRRCLVHHSVDLASLATAANITAPAPADKELPAPDSGESSDDGGSEEEAEEEEIEATAVGANDGAGDGAAPIAEPTQPPVTDENAMACKNPLASSEHEQLLARKYTDPEEYRYCAGTATEDYLDPFSFIRSLPPAPPASPQRIPVLPKKTRRTPRCTLVLDLDETLVHSSVDNFLHGADLTFPVSFEFVEYKVHVKLRPGFHEFLHRVSQLFEVVLFTASIRDYADALLDILDPEKRFIRHRLFREHCVSVQGNYIKDLSILDRDMSATVIVDNSPQAFAYQLSNGIPISSWYTDSEDRELFKLLPFLEFIASQDTDVRTVISQKFRLHERVSAAPALQPLELW